MSRRLLRRKRRRSGVGEPTEARAFAIRHRFVLVLLLAQVPVLAAVGLAQGVSIYEIIVASLLLIAMGVVGLLALNQVFAAGAVSLGLVIAAGILVRYLDGTPASTFGFFLAIVAISFYRDRTALILGFAYVAAYHVFAAVVLYRDVLTQTQDETTPVMWPAIHIAMTLVLVLLLMAGWRVTARAQVRTDIGDEGFRLSFEMAPLGMAVLSPSGEFLRTNPALAHLLADEPGRLAGANIRSIVHSYDHDLLGQVWEEMANNRGETVTTWLRCSPSDGGEIWARLDLTFLPGTGSRQAMVLLQLADAGEEHEQKRRFETLLRGKDEFVATVAEEMREPVRAILDLTAHPVAGHLRQFESHAEQIAAVVEDLIVSARADSVPISVVGTVVDVRRLCEETLTGIAGGGQIPVQIGATALWADPGLTRRILSSLIGNAVRYGGSEVMVKTTGSGPDTVIKVLDDGPEIPVAERERLFAGDLRSGQPVTSPAAVGLSLTVARYLARQMDGDIEYQRTPDGHNVFELRLPSEKYGRARVEPEPVGSPA